MEQSLSAPVTLRFTHRESEYVAAMRLFYSRVYHTRFLIGVFSIVLLLGLAFISLNVDFLLGTVTAVVGLILLLYYGYAHLVTPRQAFQRDTKFREEFTLRLSDDGIWFRLKNAESKLEWAFYSKVWETPKFYFLCYDKGMFTLIPKRVFTSSEQHRAFRELLNRKLSANLGTEGLSAVQSSEPLDQYVPPPTPPDWR